MNRMWKKIVCKNYSEEKCIKVFLLYNSIKFCMFGLIAWLIVSRRYFNTIEGAICFVGYQGMFIGYFGGLTFLCGKVGK